MLPPSPATCTQPSTPTMNQYKLRHGRLVPKADRNSIISSRSGWTSIRPISFLLGARRYDKSDKASIANVSIRGPDNNYGSPEKTNDEVSWWQRGMPDLEGQTAPTHAAPRLRSPSPDQIRSKPHPISKDRSSFRSSMYSMHPLPKRPESTIHEDEIYEPSSPIESYSPPGDAKSFFDSRRRQTFLDPPSRNSLRAPSSILAMPMALESLPDDYQQRPQSLVTADKKLRGHRYPGQSHSR